MTGGWQFFIDRGGTFTDVIGQDRSGQRHAQQFHHAFADRFEFARPGDPIMIREIIEERTFGGDQAASQGIMNNLTFGNRHHQYYETIGGGGGSTIGGRR